MRKSYRREDLGVGVRGKYAAAFPTAAAVNDALKGLLKVARKATIPRTSTDRLTPSKNGARSSRKTG